MSDKITSVPSVSVTYARNGGSTKANALGMRPMQERAYEKRGEQYLLIKSPPASGKSRALMFVALDKLKNQGLKQAIIVVPEKSIGASFNDEPLSKYGFWSDWQVEPKWNLCNAPGNDNGGKVKSLGTFLEGDDKVLVCTHATFRFAVDAYGVEAFDDRLIAVDEFHHVSANPDNKLGLHLGQFFARGKTHIVAMTGSYFRGDAEAVLAPQDESKFDTVTYTYYEQLNGYEYLKQLDIGYFFYSGPYVDDILNVLDPAEKTIIHIPNVNSRESTKDKMREVEHIIEALGEWQGIDSATGFQRVKRPDGRVLRIADLVDDDATKRDRVSASLKDPAQKNNRDHVDIIIALGMAKEGFDWPYAEHALTVGYRASLTEIIQIIGRVTRDVEGKTHAQFTNLLAEPDAAQSEVTVSVNNMLKAITASLLMEQVLAQNFDFKAKRGPDDTSGPGELKIAGLKEPSTDRVRQIVATDLNDLKAKILQDDTFARAAIGNVDPETTNKVLIPKIIREQYPELTETEVEEVRQRVVVDSVIKTGEVREVGDKRFIQMANQFVNIDELNINLIDTINPFQSAFEILSKSVTPSVLQLISDTIYTTRVDMSLEEAMSIFPQIKPWMAVNGREPDRRSDNPEERRLADALLVVRKAAADRKAELAAASAGEEE